MMVRHASKRQAQLYLNNSRAVCAGNLAEIHRTQICGNVRVLRLIERVLHVRLEFERPPFADVEVLSYRKIQIAVPGRSQGRTAFMPPPGSSA